MINASQLGVFLGLQSLARLMETTLALGRSRQNGSPAVFAGQVAERQRPALPQLGPGFGIAAASQEGGFNAFTGNPPTVSQPKPQATKGVQSRNSSNSSPRPRRSQTGSGVTITAAGIQVSSENQAQVAERVLPPAERLRILEEKGGLVFGGSVGPGDRDSGSTPFLIGFQREGRGGDGGGGPSGDGGASK